MNNPRHFLYLWLFGVFIFEYIGDFLCSSVGKESACNAGDLGSIPGLGRSPGGGHGTPLQYPCLENPHGQRSLVGFSLWGHRVGYDWGTKDGWIPSIDRQDVLRYHFKENNVVWLWNYKSVEKLLFSNSFFKKTFYFVVAFIFQTVVLEKTLESPLASKEIKIVNPTGNQAWIFIGRTDADAEAQKLWPPDSKSWLIGKDPDAGKDWRQEEKGMTENEMVG